MAKIDVRGGATQIGKVLAHARDEARRAKVAALMLIGDAMEENRSRSSLASPANWRSPASRRSCSRKATTRRARARSSEIARLTGGAYGAFDASAAARLAALLRAAAAYAAGGHAALVREAEAEPAARLLLSEMRRT